MKDNKSVWIGYVLPLLPAAYLFFQCIYVISSRIFYPYEIEWIEGGILQGVLRIVDGQPLYGAPGPDYVPSLYAPLYFYVSSLSVLIFGNGLPALRCFILCFFAYCHNGWHFGVAADALAAIGIAGFFLLGSFIPVFRKLV